MENQNTQETAGAVSGSVDSKPLFDSEPFDVYLPGTKDREPEFIATVMVETNGDFITQKSRAVLERIRRALLRERELESALHDMLSLYDNTDNQAKPGAYAEQARSLLSNAQGDS